MALALEGGRKIYCAMRQFNCGYWVIERQLADLRRVFVVFFGHVGPIYIGFWLGFCYFWAGFSGFWAVNVAGKEEVAEVAVTSLLFSRFASFLCGLGTPSCQCT